MRISKEDPFSLAKAETVLAAEAHAVWAEWIGHMLDMDERADKSDGTIVIPREKARIWRNQMRTAFDDLSPVEQASDREIARRYLALLFPSLWG